MKKFYIIYKDETVLEGLINCEEKEFIEKLVKPNKENIYSFHIFTPTEVLTEETINELM